jgi:hypothetical protein
MENILVDTTEAENNNINNHNDENNLEIPTINNENNQDVATAHLIQESNRTNNEETLALIRRVVETRDNSLRYQFLDFEDSLFDFIISNDVFIHSVIILLVLGGLFYFELNNLMRIKYFSIKHLESEEMWYLYSLGYFIIIIALWNVYLLFFKLFSFFDTIPNFRKDKLNECSSADVLFFNPFYINLIIIHYNKAYIATVLDFYIIMTISLSFSINFFFSNYYHQYLKKKINSITNIHLSKNILVYCQMKIFYIFLIGMNVMHSYLISYVTQHADFYFVYILQIKSIYLMLKQLSMWYENETIYKQLDSQYAINEEYYLNSLMRKIILNIVATVSNL